jgi:multimeric flavodoxin WrbA
MVLGVFGSPRKNKLPSQQVAWALEGATSAGAEVCQLHLV